MNQTANQTDDQEPQRSISRMPAGGRFAGEPIDDSSRRSLLIRSPAEAGQLSQPACQQVVVDHFYHEGAFWTASLPTNGVSDIFGQAFNFSKPRMRRRAGQLEIALGRNGLPRRTLFFLNHLQTRFRLHADQPVKLFPLGAEPVGTPLHQITDFVYSLEVVGPLGTGFNLRDGMTGSFLCAHRFLSTQEMVFERLVIENQYVQESAAIPFTAEEKRNALVESIRCSHAAGMSQTYYLYRPFQTNNCTSGPFQILDRVKRYHRLGPRLGSFIYRLPVSPRFYLRIRGLDADPSYRKLVRDEFTDYMGSPATRQRKREFVRQHAAARRAARQARQQE